MMLRLGVLGSEITLIAKNGDIRYSPSSVWRVRRKLNSFWRNVRNTSHPPAAWRNMHTKQQQQSDQLLNRFNNFMDVFPVVHLVLILLKMKLLTEVVNDCFESSFLVSLNVLQAHAGLVESPHFQINRIDPIQDWLSIYQRPNFLLYWNPEQRNLINSSGFGNLSRPALEGTDGSLFTRLDHIVPHVLSVDGYLWIPTKSKGVGREGVKVLTAKLLCSHGAPVTFTHRDRIPPQPSPTGVFPEILTGLHLIINSTQHLRNRNHRTDMLQRKLDDFTGITK